MNDERTRKVCNQYGYDSGCIVPGCTNRTRLHHIVPKREGGTDAISNLLAICPKHEMAVHSAGAAARAMERRPDLDVLNMWHLPRAIRKRVLKASI